MYSPLLICAIGPPLPPTWKGWNPVLLCLMSQFAALDLPLATDHDGWPLAIAASLIRWPRSCRRSPETPFDEWLPRDQRSVVCDQWQLRDANLQRTGRRERARGPVGKNVSRRREPLFTVSPEP